MGASLVYLNEPNTDIEHEVGENEYLKFAAGSMQGWRLNMVSLSTSDIIGPSSGRLHLSKPGELILKSYFILCKVHRSLAKFKFKNS